MPADPKALLDRYDRLKTQKATAESFVQELAEFVCPRKAVVTRTETEGTKQTDRQYDSTAELAGQRLAATLHGTLTSPAQKWFSLQPRDEALREDHDVMTWCEECADRLYAALNQSNFDLEVAETYQDLVYLGTGALLMEERRRRIRPQGAGTFGGFRFKALAYGEFVIEEGEDGTVDVLFRRFTLPARIAVRLWGDRVGDEVAKKALTRPEEPVQVVHAIYPRTDRRPGRVDGLSMPWASCYVLAGDSGGQLLSEGGYREFPALVPRWAKSSGETYGRGPGHTAYGPTRSLNRLRELLLEASAKAVDPPLLQKHEAVIGDVTLDPAGINVVYEDNAVQALDLKGRFDVGKVEKEDLRAEINDAFFVRYLQLVDKTQMTATEVVHRQEEMQRLLGPTFGRLSVELLRPLVERGFALMYRANAFPPPPLVLQQTGAELDTVFEGPLARAQKSVDLLAIQRKNVWLGEQVSLGNSTAADLFDADEEGRQLAGILGVPADIVRGKPQVDALRKARQQGQERAALLERLATLAEAGGKAAPLVRELNAAVPGGVAGAMTGAGR
jgi:hypothetical protein